ncbi:hypothetical protein BDW02DRAFT_229712 [Decorospora gaudefroyi]|uniref:Uncharacterized protein n=1 Tax=Decorospora gaudefroyi TaxID=184978 RepID=A0A6A5KSH8_9PLEO|nr:hypothetical protein BDW02DRAFT_229712 [Decorospora gaudefroyi]
MRRGVSRLCARAVGLSRISAPNPCVPVTSFILELAPPWVWFALHKARAEVRASSSFPTHLPEGRKQCGNLNPFRNARMRAWPRVYGRRTLLQSSTGRYLGGRRVGCAQPEKIIKVNGRCLGTYLPNLASSSLTYSG